MQLEFGSPRHWTPAARPSNHPTIQPHKLPTGGNLCKFKLTFHATVVSLTRALEYGRCHGTCETHRWNVRSGSC